MFTVLIPTFNRPELLRTALVSVSEQTAKGLIDCVIVSENGLNKGSETVCNEFKNINIKYVYQKEQLQISKHMKWLFSQVDYGYGAMLCDDDWWDIHHLELAAESLNKNNDCVAYFSNHAFARDKGAMKNVYSEWNKSLHFAKKDFLNYKPVRYSCKEVFTQCFLITPFHFSAMICRGDILRKAVDIFDSIHPTYADRILFPVISTYGDVIYNPLVTAIILFHPGMDGNTYASNEWKVERQAGSLRILKVAKDNGIDLTKAINDIYDQHSEDDNQFIFNELKVIFYERNNLAWFKDFNKILEQDQEDILKVIQQNSIKRKVKNTLKNIIYKVGSKF